jgi:hypothetical protein
VRDPVSRCADGKFPLRIVAGIPSMRRVHATGGKLTMATSTIEAAA